MKKVSTLLVAAMATLFSANVFAQEAPAALSKGNFLLGTRIGLSTINNNIKVTGTGSATPTDGSSASQISLTPTLGYFFTDNLAVGFGMDFFRTAVQDKTNNNEKSVDSKTLFGPFVRYYLPIDDSEAFFLGGVAGFGRSATDLTIGSQKQSITTQINSFGFGPGYTVIGKRNIGMEAQLKYNFGTSKSTVNLAGQNSTTTASNNGFDFVVGLTYYFGRGNN